MSEAYYHKGLTIEYDEAVPRLTIEGVQIPVEKIDGLFVFSGLPGIKVKTLFQLAREVIENSPEFKKREATKQIHLEILKQGVQYWNEWRRKNPEIRPILYNVDHVKENFPVDLSLINFSNAVLIKANLAGAKLNGVNFHEANLGGANLSGADLTGANFCRTDLYKTNFSKANLTRANLQGTQLAMTNFAGAKLVNCTIYGLSAWDLKLDGAEQKDLVILYKTESTIQNGDLEVSQIDESKIIVDDLRVAQFIYLLLHNENIRQVIDTMTSKVVLILGRFTRERKTILDAIRDQLRKPEYGYIPVLFDFDRPRSKDITGTVETLARMARFIIADLTDPSSIPHELATIVPFLRTTPVLPLRLAGSGGYSMFDDLKAYPWVLQLHEYENSKSLISNLTEVIKPANKMAEKFRSQS